jgi:hypothetical protein
MSSDVAAQRLAEAAIIENEWNEMSYKDRAAWWISAKWNGYQSTESYRRGDTPNPNESSRYGEPGFFIATRVPYYDAQAAVSTITATEPTTTTPAADPVPVPEPVSEPVPTPITEETKPITPAEEPPAAAVFDPTAASVAANILRTAAATAGPEKKKKKKHHGTGSGSNNGGKTIQISLKH